MCNEMQYLSTTKYKIQLKIIFFCRLTNPGLGRRQNTWPDRDTVWYFAKMCFCFVCCCECSILYFRVSIGSKSIFKFILGLLHTLSCKTLAINVRTNVQFLHISEYECPAKFDHSIDSGINQLHLMHVHHESRDKHTTTGNWFLNPSSPKFI